ncbi:hypothetical protein CBR_g12286 [Chara braunii]|uniref:ATP-dependent DNA helicase n=1 Tax=Chara braunii TaxID=69332 RepID=A0A388KRU4_CHABU|nr:hypothetical protein CBR_g12286 [Chara braunii]|eukprot:GBG72718.1 hypothetical protein CBR_g12286 [Chara braunii]
MRRLRTLWRFLGMLPLLNCSALVVEIRVSIVVLNCGIMKENGQRCVVEKVQSVVLYGNDPAKAPRKNTFCIETILAGIRSRSAIALTIASNGIATTLLTAGRTFHSRFRAPLKLDNTRLFLILKQSDIAELIRRADLIVWDEAPMSNKFHLEALDITLRDLCDNDEPFDGKVLLLAGDFRQVLRVVKHGSRAQQIDASMKMSPLWKIFEVHQLTENMRILSLGNDEMTRMYDHFLMQIGNGDHPCVLPNEPAAVRLPREICTDKPIDELISWTFDDVSNHVGDADYFLPRLILCSTNDDAGSVNNRVLDDFPEERPDYKWQILSSLSTMPLVTSTASRSTSRSRPMPFASSTRGIYMMDLTTTPTDMRPLSAPSESGSSSPGTPVSDTPPPTSSGVPSGGQLQSPPPKPSPTDSDSGLDNVQSPGAKGNKTKNGAAGLALGRGLQFYLFLLAFPLAVASSLF